MSYQVIARKYRPQRFSEVVGQDHVAQTLANSITQNRIAHAYLFCGPRGTGKTTLARIFAKCLNCTGGPKVEFADEDPRCQEIAEGRALDVLEIDGASNNGVEQVRELRETCRYAPATSKFKIYIIDEVHMLSAAAFNALLKTLEEPPAHVKFMFATTDPEKVLPTILSRCQRFDLRRIPIKLMVQHLERIARQEQVHLEAAALQAIARGADGGMRDAESALDQLISFCGQTITEADVLSMFGLVSQSQLLALTQAVIAGQAEAALRELDTLAHQGKDLGRLVADLLNHFRNLLVYKVAHGNLSLLEVSEAEAAQLAVQADTFTPEVLVRILEVLTDCERGLREAASKKILIEISLLKAIQARQAVGLDAVLKQLQQLRLENAGAPAPTPVALAGSALPAQTAGAAPVAEAPAPPAPALASPPPPGAPAPVHASPDLAQLWTRLLEAVGRVSGFTRSYLVEGHPVSFAKNLFTIGFDPEFADRIGLVDNVKNHTLLQAKLAELGFPQVQFKFVQAEAPAARPAPATPPAPPSETPPPRAKEQEAGGAFAPAKFKDDPLIQKALEVFKGRIAEIRA